MKLFTLLLLLITHQFVFSQTKEVSYSIDSLLRISSSGITNDGKKLVVCVNPFSFTAIYDIPTGQLLAKFPGNSDFKHNIKIDNKGNRVIIVESSKIIVWSLKDYKKIQEYQIGWGANVDFNENTSELVILENESFKIININTNETTKITRKEEGNRKFEMSNDGNYVFINSDSKLTRYDRAGQSKVIRISNLQDFILTGNSIFTRTTDSDRSILFNYYDFDGNTTKENIQYDHIYSSWGKLKPMSFEHSYYSGFKDLTSIYDDGTFSRMTFKKNIVDHHVIPKVGFAIVHEKQINVVDFEGLLLYRFDASSIQSTFNYKHEKSILFAGDSMIFQIHEDHPDQYKSHKLNHGIVNKGSGDENLIALGTTGSETVIWDLNKKEIINTIEVGPGVPVISILKKSEKLLLSVTSLNNNIKIHHSETGKLISELITGDEEPSAIDYKDDFIIVGYKSGKYSIWKKDGKSFTLVQKDQVGYVDVITAVKIKNNKAYIASRGRLFRANLLDTIIEDSKLLDGHSSYIHEIVFSENDNYLVSSSIDGSILLWDYEKQLLLESFQLDSGWVNSIKLLDSLSILSSGPGVISAFFNNTKLYYELKNPTPQLLPQVSNSDAGRQLVFSPDGNLMANTDGERVKVRDVKTGFLISEYKSSSNTVNDIKFNRTGKSIIVAIGTGLDYFDPYTGKRKKTIDLSARNRSIHQIETLKNRNLLFAINKHGWHYPLIFHQNSSQYVGDFNYNISNEKDKSIIDFAIADDGKKFATYGSNFIKVFELGSNGFKQILVFPNPKPGMHNAYWNDYMDFNDSSVLFTATLMDSPNKTVVYDLENGKQIYNEIGKLSKFGNDKKLLTMYSDNILEMIDLKDLSTTRFKSKSRHNDLIQNLAYNSKFDLFASTDIWGNQKTWDPRSGTSIHELNRFDSYTYSTILSSDGKHMVFSNKFGLFLFDFEKLKTIAIDGDNYPFTGCFHHKEGLLFYRKKFDFYQYDLVSQKTKKIYESEEGEKRPTLKLVTPSGDELIFRDENTNEFHFISLSTNEITNSIKPVSFNNAEGLTLKGFSRDSKFAYFTRIDAIQDKKIGISNHSYNLTSGKAKKITDEHVFVINNEFGEQSHNFRYSVRLDEMTSSGRVHAYIDSYKLKLENISTKKILYEKYIYDIRGGTFTEDDSLFILAHENGLITVIDMKDYQEVKQFLGSNGDVSDVSIHGNNLLVHGKDNVLTLFDIKNEFKKLWSSFFMEGKEYIVANESGFYSSSKNASKYVAFKKGTQVFPFDQFDLIYNRPDKVQESLGFSDDQTIKKTHSAYLKRLKKMGFSSEFSSGNIDIPELKITNYKTLPTKTNQYIIELKIQAKGNKSALKSIVVWINNVPIYGRAGKSIEVTSKQDVTESLKLQLIEGLNKIQVSVYNIDGIESYRKTVSITCTKPAPKPNLYFVGIGVKNYENEDMNLKYSDKDIRDVGNLYGSNKSYGKVYIDTFLNASVTKNIIPQIRKRLEASTIHDQVIFMYSGHGILDDSLDYYLTTHDIDFLNPKANGIPYEAVDDLLDNIPARKKLVLIDACNSGEVDKDEMEETNSGVTAEVVGGKGDLFKKYATKTNSFEMMQELFTDLRRGTGATVISSSSGKYFSFEDKKYQNGVYTYALKLGLEGSADSDGNAEITVTELKDYLYKKVEELTNGKQKPTARQENLEYDYKVW